MHIYHIIIKIPKLGYIPCRDYLLLWESTQLLIRCGKSKHVDGLTSLSENIVRHHMKIWLTERGASLRDWINKPTFDAATGMQLPGYGIMNPPDSAKKDIIRYPSYQTRCFEIKSGGKIGEQIHQMFFSRVSNGSVRMLIKQSEALSIFSQSKKFCTASLAAQRAKLQPYQYADLMETELKNLMVVTDPDKANATMRVIRRNSAIQKDFFSAAEYLIYAVVTQYETKYYKDKMRMESSSWADAVLID